MSITRFQIVGAITPADANALGTAAEKKTGFAAPLHLCLNCAGKYPSLLPVFVKKAEYESDAGTAVGFEGTTAGGKPFKGIYTIKKHISSWISNDFGFIDVEVPDVLGWDKDGSKVFLF